MYRDPDTPCCQAVDEEKREIGYCLAADSLDFARPTSPAAVERRTCGWRVWRKSRHRVECSLWHTGVVVRLVFVHDVFVRQRGVRRGK